MARLAQIFTPEGVQIAVVLLLSFLVGLEREEHKASSKHYSFGGVRTFPLVGLLGYALAWVSAPSVVPLTIGLAVVGALMVVSYRHKLAHSRSAGVTTEVSGLLTFLVGALVQRNGFWIAGALAIVSAGLLELKAGLQKLAARVGPEEVLSLTKFLLLSIVVLPVLPNQPFGRFHVNPFRTWLIVVVVSGISYGSYVLQRWMKGRGDVLLVGVLGGAYSSTATTVVLARRGKDTDRPHVFAGSILAASGAMYARLVVLLMVFDATLARALAPGFLALAALACGGGWLVAHRDAGTAAPSEPARTKNPLELRTALLFALVFLVMLIATRVALETLGSGGVYGLAGVMGVADVDPFVMSLTQSGAAAATLHTASIAVTIAAASNNLAKGVYAFVIARGKTGTTSLLLLAALAAAGLAPILFF